MISHLPIFRCFIIATAIAITTFAPPAHFPLACAKQRALGILSADPPDSLAQATDEAAIDSLNAYWRHIDTKWYEPLTPQSLRPGLTEAMLDSVSQVGDRELVALLSWQYWRISLAPLARFDFNRCEGLRPGLAMHGHQMGGCGPRFEVGLSYGIADERVRWDVAAKVPLAVRGTRLGARAEKQIQLNLDAGDRVVSFAGRRGLMSQIDAFLFGSDPAMHYGRRDAGAALTWHPIPDADLLVGWRYEKHQPLSVATRWSLLGDRTDVPENWAAAELISRATATSVAVRIGALKMTAGAEQQLFDNADPLAADGTIWRLMAGLRADWLTPQGHEIALRGTWLRNDRIAPLQWRQWLGGSGTLRGYPERELVGDEASLISLDVRAGFDLLRSLHFPLLENLGLQPIVFADWGSTALTGDPPPDGATGWRTNAGLGLGRPIGAWGLSGHLRLYAAKPVLNGQSGRNWQFLLEFEP